jgi:hypothetical protein
VLAATPHLQLLRPTVQLQKQHASSLHLDGTNFVPRRPGTGPHNDEDEAHRMKKCDFFFLFSHHPNKSSE